MTSLDRAARNACWVIVACMLVHNMNALWLEPTYLGFVDKARDYGDMSKILNAQFSFSFITSGTAHIICGFALLILGLGLQQRFRGGYPIASALLRQAAMLAGLGFLLTGISDIPGAVYAKILRGENPDRWEEIMLINTLIRSVVNVLAIVGLSWLAGQLAWLTRKSSAFPRWFGWYGWVMVFPGLVSFVFPPAGFSYLQLTIPWAAALGVYLGRTPTADARSTP
jgi:ABC-type Fe3+-siderophore transport system permease subunit